MKLTRQMTFRTSEEVLGEIGKIAKSSDKTVSQVINELLFRSLGLGLDPKNRDKDEDSNIEEIRQELRAELQQIKIELEQKFSQAQEEALKKLKA